MVKRWRWYIGLIGGKFQAFREKSTLTIKEKTWPPYPYTAIIGPFNTKRGALWAEKYGQGNPHFQCVMDAERMSKEETMLQKSFSIIFSG